MHIDIHEDRSDFVAAFDAAYVDVFSGQMRRPQAPLPKRVLLPRFAQHYARLRTLPRHARRSLQRQWKRTLGGIALLLALTSGTAFAATMNVAAGVVPDVNVDGKCSLNEAIFNANNDHAMHRDCPAGSGTDTIILPVGSKQVLTNSVGPLPGTVYEAQGLPKIRSAIVIEGRGSTIERADRSPIDLMIAIENNGELTLNETIVSGRPANTPGIYNRVLCIFNRGKLSISKGAIRRGYNAIVYSGPSLRLSGGGLHNEGSATLQSSTVSDNAANDNGGGIFNSGTLFMRDSTVSDNFMPWSFSRGGGLANRDGGEATVINSRIVRNSVGENGEGGGIQSVGTLTLENSIVSGNEARVGGGLASLGTANISRSTIADNTAPSYDYEGRVTYIGYGGGIYSRGSMTIVNSTISGNRAQGYGGGIGGNYVTLTLTHTTVTSNLADYPPNGPGSHLTAIGGGIFVGNAAVTRIERSLISGNQSRDKGPEIGIYARTTPTILANNFNVFGAGGIAGVQGFTPGRTDIVPTVPVSNIVMPIANNGGKGATHALAINSPALNAAPVDAKCSARDQRGNPRPQGVKCDIGSFEGSAVLCNGLVTTQVGTVNADTLTGTNGVDVIAGLNGNDTIRGLNGNDVICAGSGADKVYGGNNNDLLFGDSENDQLFGDAGNDALNGGTGTDKCNGGSGTDTDTDTATQCETRTSVP